MKRPLTKELLHIRDRLDAEKDEYLRMLFSLELYQPPQDIRDAILEAYNSQAWDWKQCDGCTGVSEAHFPVGLRLPACVLHDYLYWKVRHNQCSRWYADRMFYRANRAYGMSRARSAIRWLGVRIFGVFTA